MPKTPLSDTPCALVAVALCALLAACGGGGSSSPVIKAINDSASTDQDSVIAGNVLDNDTLEDALNSLTLVSDVAEGVLIFNDTTGEWSFDPDGQTERPASPCTAYRRPIRLVLTGVG